MVKGKKQHYFKGENIYTIKEIEIVDKKRLDTLRIITPGIFVAITIYFILYGFSEKNPLNNYMFYLISIAASVFYYCFNLRDYIWRKIDNKIFKQYIHESMEVRKKGEKISKPCIWCLIKKKYPIDDVSGSMSVFYNNIDNDKSLKEKSYQVMLNGYIMTSVIDLFIVSISTIVIEGIIYILLYSWFNKNILVACIVMVIISPILVWKLINKHLELIKNQLLSMKNFKKDEK